MAFHVKNKVAIVTGGARGIGLAITRKLLAEGVKGVSIADVNEETAKHGLQILEKEFGPKAIFIKTDISDYESFEKVFKLTVERFKSVDMLFNNAGICNEANYSKAVDVNVKGAIHGMILGFEKYLKDYKSGDEAVIVNTASIAGLEGTVFPSYSATKFAINGLTLSWGLKHQYRNSRVRVFSICPGFTDTNIINIENSDTILRPEQTEIWHTVVKSQQGNMQSPEFVADETIKLLENAPNGSIWIIEKTQPAYQFTIPTKDSFI